MDSSFCFDTIYLGLYDVSYIVGSPLIILNHKIAFFFFDDHFVSFTNGVDTDEMPHYAAFHLGIHCLPKYECRSHYYTKEFYIITISQLLKQEIARRHITELPA